MCRFREIGEPECPRAPLDGVRSTEYGVQLLRIRILDIQIEQQPFHCRQMFRRLVEEHLIKLTHVDSHATPRAQPPPLGGRYWYANDLPLAGRSAAS
ncbi:hypothetical protein SDC9_183689 [bioreactor metagenome]|uniref:Uncharacterized protein n=1 Tax=bioreactor metagenome TaxID=1076179 RepID=A0A645HCT8_9ZZZZ